MKKKQTMQLFEEKKSVPCGTKNKRSGISPSWMYVVCCLGTLLMLGSCWAHIEVIMNSY
jgi:hypothetical protein